MRTPAPAPQAAMSAQVMGRFAARTWWMIRTTPGLILITLSYPAWLVGHPWWALAGALAGVLIYREQCSRTPYAPCARCEGTGRHSKHPARPCRPCRGRGVRIRWGRAVMNGYRRMTQTREQASPARAARALTPANYSDSGQDTPTTYLPAALTDTTTPAVEVGQFTGWRRAGRK